MNPDRLGTAQWADPEAVASKFAYKEGSFWLGRTMPGQQAIGVDDDRHICVVAGTRAGKGTSVLIPNLLLWRGSVVVVDPTGDTATTAALRRGDGNEDVEGLGQAVHVLDPYRASKVDDKCRASFNPLDMLDPNSRSVVRDAERIASALVVPTERSEPWAINGARRLLSGLILHVLTAPTFEGRRSLITVRDLIARGDFVALDFVRSEGDDFEYDLWHLLWTGMKRNDALGGEIAGIGETFERMTTTAREQWTGVHDEVLSATNFINNADMRECLSSSSFSILDLKTSSKGVSLYLTIPSKEKEEDFRYLRMMVSLIMTEMETDEPRKPACGHDVLMVLDEFAGLKEMERIESGIAEIAKYGVKMCIVLQDLSQLKRVYEKSWNTFLANCGTKLFFGLDDDVTERWLSEKLGKYEMIRTEKSRGEERGESTGSQTGTSRETNWNTSESTGSDYSYKRFPLGMDGLAGFVRSVTGNAQATRSKQSSSGEGGSTGSNESTSKEERTGESSGETDRIHLRDLATPDELRKYLRRIDEDDEQSDIPHPGIMVAVLSSYPDPIVVKRCNYWEDDRFYRASPHHLSANSDRGYAYTDMFTEETIVGSIDDYLQSSDANSEILILDRRPTLDPFWLRALGHVIFLSPPSPATSGRWDESRIAINAEYISFYFNSSKRRYNYNQYNSFGDWLAAWRSLMRVEMKDKYQIHKIATSGILGIRILETIEGLVARLYTYKSGEFYRYNKLYRLRMSLIGNGNGIERDDLFAEPEHTETSINQLMKQIAPDRWHRVVDCCGFLLGKPDAAVPIAEALRRACRPGTVVAVDASVNGGTGSVVIV